MIPTLLHSTEKHGHLKLDPQLCIKVIAVSAATIACWLPCGAQLAHARRRRSVRKISKEIPIKTFSDWNDPSLGFLEIDFVVHGGGSMSGEYPFANVGRYSAMASRGS